MGLEYIPGDLGDARFINFLLEHGHQSITGNGPSFWDASFMHPFDNTIAISDNMLGTLPIYSVIRMFGLDQETAYQLWWIAICCLNFWCTFFIIKRWFGRWEIAIVVAWIFSFTIFNFAQLNYMQMTIRFMVPIGFYAAAKMVETSSTRHLALYTFAIVYQFYCVMYTGFYLMYFTLGFMLVYAIFLKKRSFYREYFKKDRIWNTLGIGVLGLGFLFLLIKPYLAVSEELGFRSFDEVWGNIPTWSAYFFAPFASETWSFSHDTFMPNYDYWWVLYTFPGYLILGCMAFFPCMWIYNKVKKKEVSKLTKAMSILAVILLVLHLRTDDGKTLYYAIFHLPGMNSIRVINRFMNVQIIIVLIAMIPLLMRIRPIWFALIFLVAFFDNAFNPYMEDWKRIRREKADITAMRHRVIGQVKHELKGGKYEAFAIVDTTQANFLTHIDAMNASLYTDVPTVNGYSSSCPGDFGLFFGRPDEVGLRSWIESRKLDSNKIKVIHRSEEVIAF